MEKAIIRNALEQVANNHGVGIDVVKREIELAFMNRKTAGEMNLESADGIVEMLARLTLERLQHKQ